MTTQWLINGLIQAGMLVVVAWALSRWARDVVGRALLAFMLFGAAVTYVYYAASAGVGPGWLAVELLGLALYVGFAVAGVRRSPLWLAAGWALHPVWDMALHYFGPGHAFAPDAYAVTCLSFDLLVAAYIVVAYRFGLTRRRDDAEAPAAVPPALSRTR